MYFNIKIEVINCDGFEVGYYYKDINEFKEEWYKEEDMPRIPMLDDELVYASIDGIIVNGETFNDVMKYIGRKYQWSY